MVTMLDDRAVAKHEACLDVIDHLTAGSAETVGSDPARCRHGRQPYLGEQCQAAALVIERQRGTQTRFAPLLPDNTDQSLAPLLTWLHEQHGEVIDLNRLAQQAHCSVRTLLRRFRQATGLTPGDYLQRLRISVAQQALADSGSSLEQIASQVGFADRATFAKRFKQLCGETLGAFRKRMRRH